MKRIVTIAAAAAIGSLAIATMPASSQDGWVTLVDGVKMGDWDKLADANWEIKDGALVADKLTSGKDPAYLITKKSYKDFQIKAEFWTDADANSGIFIRCKTAKVIDSKDCYEVNIFDKRPDPTYGTGAIVDVAKVNPMPKAAGKWNTYEITAKGPKMTVILNGEKTADAEDGKLTEGPIALQYGSGVVKFRKVQIKEL